MVCLTNEEMRQIQETGHLEVEKVDKKKKTKKLNEEKSELNSTMSKTVRSGKQLRKKNINKKRNK